MHSSFYRQREVIEIERASTAVLENVRAVAKRAAAAWAMSAELAERVEAKARLRRPQSPKDDECQISENPDSYDA